MKEIFDIRQYGYVSPAEFVTNFKGKSVKCQFHNDKNPSAQVNEKNVYCYVCQKAYYYEQKGTYKKNKLEAENCHDKLLVASNQSEARKYLKKRGLNKNDIINEFQLGYDEVKNKLVIPIKNKSGDVNGFVYVSLTDDAITRYKNSPGPTANNDSVFHKKNNLFGMDKITSSCDHLIICEGYFDVISAYNAGYNSDVVFTGLMGTALNELHLPLLKELINKGKRSISLMLDRDVAGQEATLKCIEKLLKENIFPKIIWYDQLVDNDRCITCKSSFNSKDIDEILRNENGVEHLQHLLEKHRVDWLDYLYLKGLQNEDIRKYIQLIKEKDKRGEYAYKYCKQNKLSMPFSQDDAQKKTIISLDAKNVKSYFLQEECYFNYKLPQYFKFNQMLNWAIQYEERFEGKNFGDLESPNYHIFSNKNGEYSWREYQLINPILYVRLVNVIYNNWKEIQNYFNNKVETTKENIHCYSLPVKESKSDRFSNNTARQIINWWEEIEQRSIKLALEYKCLIHTDIVDCYGSIYTHSVPQAIYGKKSAKGNRDKKGLYGNAIDRILMNMNENQTNGIPQGSALMDLIAEIILYDIDKKLFVRCKEIDISEYLILRYRDDYRIFSNNVETAKNVLKILSEILIEHGGMRLSSEKTFISDDVILSSLKKDKLHYFENFKNGESLRHDILNIYQFSCKNPNAGSLHKLLHGLHNRIKNELNKLSIALMENKDKKSDYSFDAELFISFLSQIMYQNPRTYPQCCSIIFDISAVLDKSKRNEIWRKITKKMETVPNNELLRIWLERTVYIDHDDTERWREYYEACCQEDRKTLLIKAFNGEEIWQFPEVNNLPPFDTKLLLDDETNKKLQRARDEIIQTRNVNIPFSYDETNPFEHSS